MIKGTTAGSLRYDFSGRKRKTKVDLETLVSENEFLFECTFQVHGLCESTAMRRASKELDTHFKQVEATIQAQKWRGRP